MLFLGLEVELWCFSDFWWVLTEWVFLFVFGYNRFNVSGQDTMELSQPTSQMPNAPLIGIIQPRREEEKKKKEPKKMEEQIQRVFFSVIKGNQAR
jgi:hypothetical protein